MLTFTKDFYKGVPVVFVLMFLTMLLVAVGLGAIGRPYTATGATPTSIITWWFALQTIPAFLAWHCTSFELRELPAYVGLWLIGGLAATTATYIDLRPR